MSIPRTVSRFADFKKALADDAAGRADSVREEIRCVFLSFIYFESFPKKSPPF